MKINKTILLIIGLVATLALAVVAVTTALKLREIGTTPVAPTAPEPAPASESDLTPVCSIDFTVSAERGNLCESSSISAEKMPVDGSLTMTITANKPVKKFMLAFYNPNNLSDPSEPRSVTGIQYVAGDHYLIVEEVATAAISHWPVPPHSGSH